MISNLTIIFLFVVAVVAALSRLSIVKGMLGEWLVRRIGKLFLPAGTYHALHNVTLPTKDGTTQIDHIYVSRYGIFVVESKNMKGWIFGSPNQAQWTQKIYRQSFRFQNPIRQNYKHVKALESLLGVRPDAIHSVVVFVGDCTFKTPMPPGVTRGAGYVRYIRSFHAELLTDTQVFDVLEKIAAHRLEPSLKTHRDHVAHLQARFNPVASVKSAFYRMAVLLSVVAVGCFVIFIITDKMLADMGARSIEQSRALIAQQRAQAEQAKIARLQQQQAAKRAQLQQAELRKARERERQRIYAAWQASYQEPPECSHYDSDEKMVWCVNHKKKSRDEFFRVHAVKGSSTVSVGVN